MTSEKKTPTLALGSTERDERRLLPHEISVIRKELASLAVIQSMHGELLGEAMNQAAETYHDNAPAEIIRDDQEVLMRRAKPLIHMIKHHVIIPYPDREDPRVRIGSRVGLRIEGSDENFSVEIVGFRPNNPPTEEDTEVLSYEAPFAMSLLDHEVGDVIGGIEERTRYEITDIDQTALSNRYSPQ